MTRKDEKIAQIIYAATAEFLEKGIQAASMLNIAQTAKVSTRTLYKYYPNKEELYSALIDELLDNIFEVYNFQYNKDLSIKEQVGRIVDIKIKLNTSTSFMNISKIVIGEMLRSRKPSSEQMARLYDSEVQFNNWIDDAKKDGKITSNLSSKKIGEQFHAILKAQIFYPVLFQFTELESVDLKEVREETINFFIQSFCK